ncbi:MAG TPA: hypothetical protein VJU60_13595 [Thermoleophilaceae bacterium]|nr:hypothetical protein [Thermoleophilaceae bacterium]
MPQPAATGPDGHYWAGYRFTPRLIAGTRSAVWVVENHLPLLVRVDPGTGELTGPSRVGHGDPAGRGAHDLLAHGDDLWIRWNDGITRFRPADGDECWVDLSAAGLAAGDAGVWALTGDGRLAHLDPAGPGFEPVGEPEVRRHSIGVGHGAVWALTWTHVPGGSTVSRIDPASGEVNGQLAIQGSPRQLIVGPDAVYVRVWRRDGERVEESVLRIDARDAELQAEFSVPRGAGSAVLDGVIWSPEHDDNEGPASVRRVDAATGKLLGSVGVPGSITSLSPGPGGMWASVERRARPGGCVLQLSEEAIRAVDLDALDMAAHLPA